MKLSLPPSLSAKLSLDALSQRERVMLAGGGVLAVLIFVFGIVIPLDRSVTTTHRRVDSKQADLIWMRQVAPELVGSSPPPAAASQDSLLVIVDRSARESGLGSSIAGSEPNGANALSVRFQRAPFDTLIAWLARLAQQDGIRVDSATIDSTGAPGIVNAAVVLRTG